MGERLTPIGHPPLSEDEANRLCNALADPELCRQFWANRERPDNWPDTVPFPTNFNPGNPRHGPRVVKEEEAA